MLVSTKSSPAALHEYSRSQSVSLSSRPVLMFIAVTDHNNILSNHDGHWRCSFCISALAIANCDFRLSSSMFKFMTLTTFSVCIKQSKIAQYVQETLSTL